MLYLYFFERQVGVRLSPCLILLLLFAAAAAGAAETAQGTTTLTTTATNNLVSDSTAVANVDTSSSSVAHPDGGGADETTIVPCPILSLLPFGTTRNTGASAEDTASSTTSSWNVQVKESYDLLAATQMAIDHFNTRNNFVVQELENYPTTVCNVQFTSHYVANTSSATSSSKYDDGNNDDDSSTAVDKSVLSTIKYATKDDSNLLCGILGPDIDDAIQAVSYISSSYNIPQLLYTTVGNELLHPTTHQYSSHHRKTTTIGIGWTYETRSKMILDFLAMPGYYRKYLVIVYEENDSYFSKFEFQQTLLDLGKDMYDVDIFLFEIPRATSSSAAAAAAAAAEDDLRDVFERIKSTGIRTIYLNVHSLPRMIDDISPILDDVGLLDDNYMYVLSPEAIETSNDKDGDDDDDSPTTITQQQLSIGSTGDRLLSGALVFHPLDNFLLQREGRDDDGDGKVEVEDDPFFFSWKGLDSTFVERINALLPFAPKEEGGTIPQDYFQIHNPSPKVAFVYDAIMALGIGKCNAIMNASTAADGDGGGTTRHLAYNADSSTPLTTTTTTSSSTVNAADDVFKLDPYISAITQDTNFHGATGPFNFLRNDKIRNPSSITVGVYNIRPVVLLDEDEVVTPYHTYETVLTFIWKELSGWAHYNDETNIWRNGDTNVVEETRVIAITNYLSDYVRGIGFLLFGIACLLNIVCLVSLKYMYNDSIIQRSQPFFLVILCIGSLLTSTSIFTLSFDEGATTWKNTDQILSVFCMITPWVFFVGHITSFATLATKLYRIDKVLQFKRGNKVTIRQVIAPLVVVLLLTLSILTVWTILDPWKWNRELIHEMPSETYGECTCRDGNAHFWYYFGPLMTLLIVSEIATIFFAYKTSDVPEDFRDTNAIYYAIVTQLQAWFIGIPILAVLGTTNVDATYFGRVLLIWIFSISSVAIVVCPKILQAVNFRRHPELAEQAKRKRVQVSGLSNTTQLRESASINASFVSPNIRVSNFGTTSGRISNVSTSRMSDFNQSGQNWKDGAAFADLNESGHSKERAVNSNLNLSGHSTEEDNEITFADLIDNDHHHSTERSRVNSHSSCGSFDLMEPLAEAENEETNNDDEDSSPPSPSVRVSMSGAINSSSDEVGSEYEV